MLASSKGFSRNKTVSQNTRCVMADPDNILSVLYRLGSSTKTSSLGYGIIVIMLKKRKSP